MSDERPSKQDNKQRQQAIIWKHQRDTLKQLRDNEELLFDECITWAEDERMEMAKENNANTQRLAIDKAHVKRSKPTVGLWQQGCNIVHRLKSAFD